jgi:hypothetical protein
MIVYEFIKSGFIIRQEEFNGKGSSYAYVILVLSFGQSGNINNTGRMQKAGELKNLII